MFQANLKKDIERRFDPEKKRECIVMKTDPHQIQGIPDLLILYKNKWASLECKKSEYEKRQPNQEYWVKHMNKMSFSRFIYPENKERVLNELEKEFKK